MYCNYMYMIDFDLFFDDFLTEMGEINRIRRTENS